jgi:hypothetical protein
MLERQEEANFQLTENEIGARARQAAAVPGLRVQYSRTDIKK